MSGNPARWLAAVASAGLLAAGVSAAGMSAAGMSAKAATVPAHGSVITQDGPAEVGNLLDYANTDFEGTIGDWTGVSNATLTDDTTHAFLHHDSLLDTAAANGTSSFTINNTTSPVKIGLNGGSEFRVGAYFKAAPVAGQTMTVQFTLNCWGPAGYLQVVKGAPRNLADTTLWQYVEDDITVPSGCTYVQGSPKVTVSGLTAGAGVNMDEVIFAPYRAALIIGAHGENELDGKLGYDGADWVDTNWTSTSLAAYNIGPLESDKEFFGGKSHALPSQWDDSTYNNCYEIEQLIDQGGGSSAEWPACLINLQSLVSQGQLASYLKGLPPAQMVILTYHDEPEGKFASGAKFVQYFDQESLNIRNAAVNPTTHDAMPNVFVAVDSSTFQYGSGLKDRAGMYPTTCGYIPPTTSTDFYLADHYDFGANGKSLPDEDSTIPSDRTTTNGQKWSNWLNCVQRINKPLGLAEYGLDCTTNPNQKVVTTQIGADKPYLGDIPGATEPTIMWEYWYGKGKHDPGCVYSNQATISEWQSIETQNGGG